MKQLIYILSFIFLFINCYGQDVSFTAQSPSTVGVGNQFSVQYTINQKVSGNVSFPDMNGFVRLSGPNASTSSNFQWINGKTSQSTTTTYTFYLQSTQEGVFTFAPATVTIDGKKYESNRLEITVTKNAGQSSAAPTENKNTATSDGNNLYISANLNKRELYVGEATVMSYNVYSRVDIAGFGNIKFPPYSGFWKEDYDIGTINLQRTTIDNLQYNTAEINRCILFPQQTGDIVIQGAEIEVVTRVKTKNSGFNDPFFGDFFGGYQNVPVQCKTKPITVHVKPLPAEGKPVSFSGAVGKFSISTTIDKTELKANDAITLKYTVSGTGNVKLIDKINVNFPSDFETYAPKISQNTKVNSNSVTGSKTFEYVIIPRNSGTYKIKSFEFSYFDTEKNKYNTLTTPELTIEVADSDLSFQTFTDNSMSREDIVTIGSDIRHIKNINGNLKKTNSVFFASTQYFVALISITVLIIIIAFIIHNYLKTANNIEIAKKKKAVKIAVKRLKRAKQYMENNSKSQFYNEITDALWQYVSDRFAIHNSDLSRDYLMTTAERNNIDKEEMKKYIEVLDDAEFARFSSSNNDQSMQNMYDRAKQAIQSCYEMQRKTRIV